MFKRFILILVAVVFLVACERDRKSKLVGRWDKIFFHETSIKDVWSFTSTDSAFWIRTFMTSGETDTLGSGKFLLKNNVVTITGPIGANETNFKGDHKIADLDEDFLILYRDDVGLLTQEFQKE